MIVSGIRSGLTFFGAPVVVGAALLQSQDGGYDLPEWGAAALVFVGLLAVAAGAGLLAGPRSRLVALSLWLFGAYTAWSFLSITWAEVKGDAWDGANRTLLYLVVYSLVVLLPWRVETVVVLLAAVGVLTAALGLGSLVVAAMAADPDPYFIAGRFSAPMGYQNGNCALFLMGFFAALPLAARREISPVARGVLLASAGASLQLAVLTQSRASLVAAPVALAVLLTAVPGRMRTLAALTLVAVAVAVSGDVLLDVFPAIRGESDDPGALDSAAVAVCATAAALLVVGSLAAVADRRFVLPDRVALLASRAAPVAVAALLMVGAAGAVTRVDHPVRSIEDAWSSFKEIEEPGAAREIDSTYYLGSGLGGNRYDLWRVALAQFREHPLVGVGSENFAVDYLRERRTFEETLHPHSLVLRALGQTGLIGALLLAGALAAAIAAGVGALRGRGLTAVASATGLAVFAYWLVHGFVDWFWELPGLGVGAFVALGLAASLAPRQDRSGGSRLGATVAKVATAAALVAAAATLGPAWLAAKETEAAGARWRTAPEEAFARLERARTLNPLSEKPDLFAAVIAGKLGDLARMRPLLVRAIERKPSSWYAHFELGLVEGIGGNREAALGELEIAERLNPLEPTIDEVERRVRRGQRLTLAEYDRLFLARARAVGR